MSASNHATMSVEVPEVIDLDVYEYVYCHCFKEDVSPPRHLVISLPAIG